MEGMVNTDTAVAGSIQKLLEGDVRMSDKYLDRITTLQDGS